MRNVWRRVTSPSVFVSVEPTIMLCVRRTHEDDDDVEPDDGSEGVGADAIDPTFVTLLPVEPPSTVCTLLTTV